MESECIKLLEWMRKNEVNIATDEKGDFAFDIGVNNFSAKTLYDKFKSEEFQNNITSTCTTKVEGYFSNNFGTYYVDKNGVKHSC